MSAEFTYPSLRCILEHLDPNKRIHIAARSPEIRPFDKSVPIHLTRFKIRNDGFDFDFVRYELSEKYERLTHNDQEFKPNNRHLAPGDLVIRQRSKPSTLKYVGIRFSGPHWASRKAPLGLRKREASKILYEAILGYKTIYMWCLSIELDQFVVLRLPENLKIRPRIVSTGSCDLLDILPIIDLNSLPLLHVTLSVYDRDILKHPIVRTAKEEVTINLDENIPIEVIYDLPNTYVTLKRELSMEDMIGLINYWIGSGKSMGSRIEFKLSGAFDWKSAAEQFGGVLGTLKDKSPCLFTPISTTLQLVVCNTWNITFTIKVEPIVEGVQQNRISPMPLEEPNEQPESDDSSLFICPALSHAPYTRTTISFFLLLAVYLFLAVAVVLAIFYK